MTAKRDSLSSATLASGTSTAFHVEQDRDARLTPAHGHNGFNREPHIRPDGLCVSRPHQQREMRRQGHLSQIRPTDSPRHQPVKGPWRGAAGSRCTRIGKAPWRKAAGDTARPSVGAEGYCGATAHPDTAP